MFFVIFNLCPILLLVVAFFKVWRSKALFEQLKKELLEKSQKLESSYRIINWLDAGLKRKRASENSSVVQLLIGKFQNSESWIEQLRAINAVSELADRSAIESLTKVRDHHQNPSLRAAAKIAISKIETFASWQPEQLQAEAYALHLDGKWIQYSGANDPLVFVDKVEDRSIFSTKESADYIAKMCLGAKIVHVGNYLNKADTLNSEDYYEIIEKSSFETVVQFAELVDDDLPVGTEEFFRNKLEDRRALIFDFSKTRVMGGDWWRMIARLGECGKRLGVEVVVWGASEADLRVARMLGAESVTVRPKEWYPASLYLYHAVYCDKGYIRYNNSCNPPFVIVEQEKDRSLFSRKENADYAAKMIQGAKYCYIRFWSEASRSRYHIPDMDGRDLKESEL